MVDIVNSSTVEETRSLCNWRNNVEERYRNNLCCSVLAAGMESCNMLDSKYSQRFGFDRWIGSMPWRSHNVCMLTSILSATSDRRGRCDYSAICNCGSEMDSAECKIAALLADLLKPRLSSLFRDNIRFVTVLIVFVALHAEQYLLVMNKWLQIADENE